MTNPAISIYTQAVNGRMLTCTTTTDGDIRFSGGAYGPHRIAGDATNERVLAHWIGYCDATATATPAEDDDTTWIRNDNKRADASEAAYNAALERGGSQDECNAAAETAYDECAARQRQAAEQAYQDAHR